jgi:hypothetical protein
VATQVFGILLRHLCGVPLGGDASLTKPCILVLDEAQFMHTSDWQLTVAIGKAMVLPPADPSLHTSGSSGALSSMSPSTQHKTDSALLVGSPLVGTASVGWSPLTGAHAGMHGGHHAGPSSSGQYSTLKINSGHLTLKPDLLAPSSMERHHRAPILGHLNLTPTSLVVS